MKPERGDICIIQPYWLCGGISARYYVLARVRSLKREPPPPWIEDPETYPRPWIVGSVTWPQFGQDRITRAGDLRTPLLLIPRAFQTVRLQAAIGREFPSLDAATMFITEYGS